MRLLLLASAALMGGAPGGQTIAGTISANSGSSITVSSGERSVTCVVPGTGAAAIRKWGVGVRVGMACKRADGRLVLVQLKRLGVTEPQRPTTTTPVTTRTEPAKTEPTRTEPTSTQPKPAPPVTQQRREARGVVIALAPNYGVAVQPDGGGELLKCAITPAPDSQQAATKLALNAHVGIVCRLDGGRYVLAGATPIG